jgi:hypothetical protein
VLRKLQPLIKNVSFNLLLINILTVTLVSSKDKDVSSNKKSSTDASESEDKQPEVAPHIVTQVTPAQTARAEIDKSESSDHESSKVVDQQPADVSEISSSDNDSDDSE